MYRKELNERSPLRVFEQSIHGGLGPGNIGVAAGRHGVGKTAFLVGVALDDLMRGRRVLHVALDQPVEKVREYYDEIFIDLARSSGLEDVGVERLEMERSRNIHSYLGGTFSVARLREAVGFLREHAHFVPRALVIDGYDFEKGTAAGLAELRGLAGELEAEVWMSAVVHRDAPRDPRGIPEPVARLQGDISVIVSLAHDGKAVHLRLLKDHDNPDVSDLTIALDPVTMLLVRE
ncbi:MAG TPA: hypothetical protein VJV23_10570 [Candidatus Polarisedimenticolia bacterium]|nr:hypothetical protein [Candidatus Polarisedimenticolia bacterium]